MISNFVRQGSFSRSSRNAHRFICFINGKIKVFITDKREFKSILASLCGVVSGLLPARANALPKGIVAASLLMGLLSPYAAYALPSGWQIVTGDVSFEQQGNVLNVTSGSQKAIVNYQSFNVAAGETVNFNFLLSGASILNRVIGGSASSIAGAINGNGAVYLVNPAGINFASSACVNVGSLLASTLNIANQDYLNGNYAFRRDAGAAGVRNDGQIAVGPDGHVVLIGSAIQNNGNITAPGVALAVGDQVTVDVGQGLSLKVTVDEALKQKVEDYQAALSNAGDITAARSVELKADVDQALYQQVVNNEGVIVATGVELGDNGRIVLNAKGGDLLNSGTLQADSGSIRLEGDRVSQSGNVLAGSQDGLGGSIQVLGDEISLQDGSLLDASGALGGGEILVGGDYQGGGETRRASKTEVTAGANLLANAQTSGNGGKVIVWADDTTVFNGKIEARGGAQGGNGGLVETSGLQMLDADGQVDASAPQGAAGLWLLDPNNLNIIALGINSNISSSTSGGTTTIGTTNNSARVKGSTIQAALNGGTNVVIQTGTAGTNSQDGNITVDAGVNILKSSGGDATLTLKAHNSILFEGNILGSITIRSTSNKLNLVLNADSDGSGAGAIKINRTTFTTNGGSITLGGGSNPATTAALGVVLNNDGVNISNSTLDAGAGNISIRGQGRDVLLGSFLFGVDINGSELKTTSGNITLVGKGGDDSLFSSYGVRLSDSKVSTTSGTVNVTGTAGDGLVDNVGLFVDNSDVVANGNGTINLTGTGGSGLLGGNHGVRLHNESTVVAKGNGAITLTGVAGAGSSSYGLYDSDGPHIVGNNSMTGNITLVTDKIDLDSLKLRTAGVVTFRPYGDSTDIGIHGGAGTLQLGNNTLGLIDTSGVTPSKVVFGNAASGSGEVTIANGWNFSAYNAFPLEVYGGSITSGGLTAGNTLLLRALSGDVTLGGGALSSSASGNALVLAASQDFINNAGASALSTPNGRWLVYSTSPVNSVEGDLAGSRLYGRTFAGNPPGSISQSGNLFLYAISPVLTVKADDVSRTYGSPNVLTSTITGFLDGDSEEISISGAPSLFTLATQSSDVGDYEIDAGLGTLVSEQGYQFEFENGTLTIDPASLTVTADDASRTYGAENPEFSVSYSGFVLDQDESVLGGALNFYTSANLYSDVGDYDITPSGLTSGNYEITFNNGTLSITPAPLTITANNASRPFGQPNPPFSATYSGFVLGQGPEDLDSGIKRSFDEEGPGEGGLQFYTPATTSSAPGQYGITPFGLYSRNYEITYVDGVLTITPVSSNNPFGMGSQSNPGNVLSGNGQQITYIPGNLQSEPVAFVMTDEGKRMYVADPDNYAILVFDMETQLLVDTINVNIRPTNVQLSDDENTLFVFSSLDDAVLTVDLMTNEVISNNF